MEEIKNKVMRPTFKETTDKLVQLYLKDELKHGDCAACVVGSLLGGDEWNRLFVTESLSADGIIIDMHQVITDGSHVVVGGLFGARKLSSLNACPEIVQRDFYKGLRMVELSGYSIGDLARIENAFESVLLGKPVDEKNSDESMFNGLMAVVSTLAEIHGVDLETTQQAKSLFVKA